MPDWDGEQYAQTSDLQRAMATSAVAGLDLDRTTACSTSAAATDFVTRLLAETPARGRAVGVDASPRMIAKADTASSNVQFVLATPATCRSVPSSTSWCRSTPCTGWWNSSAHWDRSRRRPGPTPAPDPGGVRR